MPDDNFIQSAFTKATRFFKLGILPELLGNWYSNLPVRTQNFSDDESSSTTDSDDDQESWSLDSGEGEQELIADSGDDLDSWPANSGDDIDQDNLKTSTTGQSDNDSDSEELWCICREPEYGQMIACDNDQCPIVWFHTACLKLKRVPQGNWYCPECKNKDKSRSMDVVS